ncbi:DUF4097 family beta strand repeat-containing protein [Opitutus terrae]|uniref:DUF4097 domain-containing protein n=1 Tax=Opitutus terrae (strain DSM 11246 / JCM 15787 / PB90-1) TaxID=452637 RepID=B1ZSL4_OPITP|nr:DUF4097 family beta strand repeat-containing protein [Opitutus terrae]ACB73871.1 hypothetical protein Oter_0581 [Opitutus terrae PB90-1]
MKTTRLLPFLLATAVLAVAGLPAASADEVETSTIKFSNPSQPGTLKLSVTNGDIDIRGTDAAEISIRTSVKQHQERRKDGMRVLSSSSSYTLVEKDNVVTLNYGSGGWHGASGDFTIEVPRTTKIVVTNAMGGDVKVHEIGGDIEIKSLNGEVKLDDISGGALVETMNGEIHVTMKALAADKPLSFTSMNGEVRLRVPADAKANVRLRSQNGAILTDFDEKELVTTTASLRKRDGGRNSGPTSEMNAEISAAVRDAVRVGVEATREAARAAREAMREAREEMGNDDDGDIAIPVPPMPPLPPMTGGKIVTGTLNGGGPEILVSTMNGDVTLQKAN